MITNDQRRQAQALLRYIDASPSPWHAVATSAEWLEEEGFHCLEERQPWALEKGGRYYVIRDDSSLIAFIIGEAPLPQAGFRIVGAHTDSPGLRIKPKPLQQKDALLRLGVEIYGSPILATWADRDLSLAGRIALKTEISEKPAVCLLDFESPMLRLPNLAIHMNRTVNEEGLKLNPQTELPLILAVSEQLHPEQHRFEKILAEPLDCQPEAILGWELNVYDTQKGTCWGSDEEFIAASRLDNLASCHGALSALLAEDRSAGTRICALFDHEEIGSESHKGANGSFLADTLSRIGHALALQEDQQKQSLAASFMISADMAHAYQPNFDWGYDGEHKVLTNHGPVIKTNANLRYTTEAFSQALFVGWCEEAGVAWQHYVHRSDLPCGSTIGPLLSARLGVRSIDVGNPLWAMHSIRESAGVKDHSDLIRVLERFFACPIIPVNA